MPSSAKRRYPPPRQSIREFCSAVRWDGRCRQADCRLARRLGRSLPPYKPGATSVGAFVFVDRSRGTISARALLIGRMVGYDRPTIKAVRHRKVVWIHGGGMRLSVAYQGGGARVVELMAAAVACQTAQARYGFEVIRVSGASAGAIAAAMHATGCDIAAVVAHAPKLEKEVLRRFPASRLTKASLAKRFLFGQSIYDEADLRAFIVDLFKAGGVDAERPIRDLAKPGLELRILRSDIRFSNSPTATETSESRLADALVDSAAIPFAFRMPRSASNPEILDGGLFQNLPAKAAMEGLAPGEIAIGFSFAKEVAPDLRAAKPLAYATAILNSLLNERLDDAAAQIKPGNIILIPDRRSTFDFRSIFSSSLAATFSEDVAATERAIMAWKRTSDRMEGPDWHSDHPSDLAEQASRTQAAVTEFYEDIAAGIPYHADLVHHEVVYQSFNEDMPDIYRLTARFHGSKNPGLQFMRFFFYDSEEGPLKRADLEVLDKDGNPRKAMMLPFRVPGTRVRATLVCLDRPLRPEDEITVVKTEESFAGMSQYTAEGFNSEQVSIGPGKQVDEIRVSVHFPNAMRPGVMEDASQDRPKDAALLSKQTGLQLATTTSIDDGQRVGCRTVTSATTNTGPSEQRRFVRVVYYRL